MIPARPSNDVIVRTIVAFLFIFLVHGLSWSAFRSPTWDWCRNSFYGVFDLKFQKIIKNLTPNPHGVVVFLEVHPTRNRQNGVRTQHAFLLPSSDVVSLQL